MDENSEPKAELIQRKIIFKSKAYRDSPSQNLGPLESLKRKKSNKQPTTMEFIGKLGYLAVLLDANLSAA